MRSPGCCPWWGRQWHQWLGGGLGAARTVGGRGVRDPPSGSLSRRVWNRAQCKVRMLRRALWFGTKDVTRTLVVCTPGGKEARRVPGTEPGRREVAPRSQAARGGVPARWGRSPQGRFCWVPGLFQPPHYYLLDKTPFWVFGFFNTRPPTEMYRQHSMNTRSIYQFFLS